MLALLEKEFEGDLRLVYRHYPLAQIHDKALLATQASEAAGIQGKFWEMHDLLFAKQSEWNQLSIEEFEQWLIDQADKLGLDTGSFRDDLNSEALVSKAQDAWDKNFAAGIPSTPFLIINGLPYTGPTDASNLTAILKTILLEQKQFSECPPKVIDVDKQYFAIIEMEKGDITVELFADKAPLAVNNFVFLAQEGWYEGITFHRVLPDFVAQAGDPSGTGFGGPGYTFDNEIDPSLVFDSPGLLAMANAGPGTNGSQFFITYAPAPQLDGNYTIFGRVIEGMDVVERITPRDPSQSMDLPPGDKIIQITIEEK